jgi:hypothetical protein
MISAPAANGTRPARGVNPWSSDEVARLIVTNAVGLVMLLAAWYQTAGVGQMRTALTWLCLGMAGLITAAVANGLWLLRGLRAIGLAGADVISPRSTATPALSSLPDSGAGFVSGPQMSHYHRPACPLVIGRELTVAARAAHEGAGLSPCGVCEP